MGANPKLLPNVSGQAANVGALRALDSEAEIRRRPVYEFESLDLDVSGRPIDRLTAAGFLIKPLSIYLHGRIHRRDLLDGPREPRPNRFQVGHREMRYVVPFLDFGLSVKGRGLFPETYRALVRLRKVHEGLLQASRRTGDQEDQESRSHRVKSPGMPHFFHAGPLPHSFDNVEGGTTLRLIDEKRSPLLERIRQIRMLIDKFRGYVALGGV